MKVKLKGSEEVAPVEFIPANTKLDYYKVIIKEEEYCEVFTIHEALGWHVNWMDWIYLPQRYTGKPKRDKKWGRYSSMYEHRYFRDKEAAFKWLFEKFREHGEILEE